MIDQSFMVGRDAFVDGLLEEFKELGVIGGHAFGRRSLGAVVRSS